MNTFDISSMRVDEVCHDGVRCGWQVIMKVYAEKMC